jgi:hypothetical protein
MLLCDQRDVACSGGFVNMMMTCDRRSVLHCNSPAGDTKGIVGPSDTWRDIQFKKVRLLSELYGLRPWYCNAAANACPCKGAGCNIPSSSSSSGSTTGGGGSSSSVQILTMPHAGAAVDLNNLFSLSLSIGRKLKALAPSM